jgi:hypothetical protein
MITRNKMTMDPGYVAQLMWACAYEVSVSMPGHDARKACDIAQAIARGKATKASSVTDDPSAEEEAFFWERVFLKLSVIGEGYQSTKPKL